MSLHRCKYAGCFNCCDYMHDFWFFVVCSFFSWENLTISPVKVLNIPKEQEESEALEILKKVGLESKALSKSDSLSGGQKQRISIARALAMRPKAVLFDEPTASLDPQTKKEIAGVIESFEEGLTLLIVTHEPEFVERIATRIVKFGSGCKVLSDTKR